jgi:predicted adenine nucleotide alpha hydrolase (AANH) superfamily ATPase
MKILLHACCAVCAAAVIERLKKDDHEVVVFFYNPNIFPREEYDLRRKEVERFCGELDVVFVEGEYNHEDWLDKVKNYSIELEGGKRCEICFAIRLSEASQMASELKCDAMATTLTISPHKNAEVVNCIGKECAAIYGLQFLDTIWRKADGFKRACEIAKEKEFYHQNYCGCEFSIKK